MRLSVKVIAATAIAVLLVPAFNLFASEAAKPAAIAGDNKSSDASSKPADASGAVTADPAELLPSAPLPSFSLSAAMP